MPATSQGQVTSSGRGIAGLFAVWAQLRTLLMTDVPALLAALGRLR